MQRRKTANISLTPALERFIAAQLASGRYQSASEVVREGLRLIEERQRERIASLDDLRRELAVGLRQAREGQLLDGPAEFRKLRTRLSRAQSGARRRAG